MLGAKNLDKADSKKRFRNEEEDKQEYLTEDEQDGKVAGKSKRENVQKTMKKTQIQNTNTNAQHFFSRLFLPLNTHALPRFCTESLQRICVEYKISNELHVIKQLNAIASDRNTPRNLLLTLFFLLFNIDTELKTIVLQNESTATQRKVCQFALLLRHEIIPQFFIDEKKQLYKFVESCEEAYLLA